MRSLCSCTLHARLRLERLCLAEKRKLPNVVCCDSLSAEATERVRVLCRKFVLEGFLGKRSYMWVKESESVGLYWYTSKGIKVDWTSDKRDKGARKGGLVVGLVKGKNILGEFPFRGDKRVVLCAERWTEFRLRESEQGQKLVQSVGSVGRWN